MERIKLFIKRETVLCASFVLAVISCFFVHPNLGYVDYIDFRSLGILYSLMLVMLGFRDAGVFSAVGIKLLKSTKNVRQLSLVLVLLCFVFSMFITNDVALITFVPFAMFTLEACDQDELILPVVALQTVAANLGSMLMPMGNPQNLYLYQLSGYSLLQFVEVMLPYSIVSLICILIICFINTRENEKIQVDLQVEKIHKVNTLVYLAAFFVCLLVVLKVVDYRIGLMVAVVAILVRERKLIAQADYSLLLTFVFFFIFTGNLGKIESVSNLLMNLLNGHETIVSILASQAISNVPATLLLSGFTTDYNALLIGVNVGGLGTLIASMASLISYKLFVREFQHYKGQYFRYFTLINVILLVVLLFFNRLF